MTIPVKARRDGNTVVALGEFESGNRIPPEHLELLVGAAESLDANGNPTPNTTDFPPANFPVGTVFFANSGPSAQDNGTGVTTTYSGVDMRFRRTGSSGSEAWTFEGGTFRASNSNGDYQRDADGTQECWHRIALTYAFADLIRATWTFPAEFAATSRRVSHTPTTDGYSITPGIQQLGIVHTTGSSTTAVTCGIYRISGMTNFGAADTMNTDAKAVGNWAA